MNGAPLEDDVPVLMITEAQLEGRRTETDTKILHSIPCDDGMNTEKSALPEILQMSDGTVNKEPLTTRNSVTLQTIDPTVGKL